MTDPVIGFISGTGPQGRGLALRFALAGVQVVIGSRDAARGKAAADELNGALAARKAPAARPIRGTDNREAIGGADFVVLTVPFEHAAATLRAHVGDFRPGSAFVDVTVPLAFGKGDVLHVPPAEGSGSRHLRAILPEGIPLLGAYKTLPAHVLEDLEQKLDCNAFIFGDDREAKQRLLALSARIQGLHPLDVGGLSAAATVEGMTALLIRINRRHKGKEGRFRVVGLE
ncbi:MAG: NADPH-dependent F420 reductase [Candidatus Lambdaproteobacteria bacterium]|nr:NADPH-dependent F420 reductase [Candidatus Lambdaproteobacteria bacterium]